MKNRIVYINISLLCALLFAMLFQSVHSLGHIVHEFTSEKCHHQYGDNQPQITHEHHTEKCFSCEYRFGNYTTFEFFHFKNFTPKKSLTLAVCIPQFFTVGDRIAAYLRGPPVVTA